MAIKRRFENRGPGHYKFWEIIYPEHNDKNKCVIVKWGKIGTKSQTSTYNFHSYFTAYDFAGKKIDEKLNRKGYHEVSIKNGFMKALIKFKKSEKDNAET